jgi:hypothetical protein
MSLVTFYNYPAVAFPVHLRLSPRQGLYHGGEPLRIRLLASLKKLGLLKALAEAAGTTTVSIRKAADKIRI